MNWRDRFVTRFYAGNRFIRFVIEHFIKDECAYIASALAFASLLAVVPLMSVGFTVFSAFPVFHSVVTPLQNFIFDNFVPSTGKIIQAYLLQFSAQVTKLSIFGIIFLMITALLVMLTIERAMNKIWRVPTSRHGTEAFLLFWAILSLAPLLLGLSLVASSYLFSMPLLVNHTAPSILLHISAFILSLIGFTFLYLIVPNCTVKIAHAFGGGLIAAVLFETAKQGFAYSLSMFNTYELLYGAFATVPLFFIWVYWVWIITLLGAEISYAFSVHHQRRTGVPLDGFSHALLWLHKLWLAQQNGTEVTFNGLIDATTKPFAVDVNDMITTLIDQKLIHVTSQGHYMLSRDMSQITLYTLTQKLPYPLPKHWDLESAKSNDSKQWTTLFKKHDEGLQESLSIDLERLFKKG